MRPRLVILLLVLGIAVAFLVRHKAARSRSVPDREAVAAAVAREVGALQSREAEVDQGAWARDLLAERCGLVVSDLWDGFNRSTNKWGWLRALEVPVIPPRFGAPEPLMLGVERFVSSGADAEWPAATVMTRFKELQDLGWQPDGCEFRHEQFDTDAEGRPVRSRYYFSAHMERPGGPERAALRGDLVVEWSAAGDGRAPGVKRVDARGLELVIRRGELPFQPWLAERVEPPAGSHFIDPMLLRDLDGDGVVEIVLVSANRVFRLGKDMQFASAPLCRFSPGLVFTAVLEDFDGDGVADLLVARFEGLVLFKGSAGGVFDLPGRLAWSVQPHLKYGQVLTCGDVDGDGDLDVWLGQYKPPYERGQMPTPYFDANDGNPSYLLSNDGHGNFTDSTRAAGLDGSSHRRTYSGSLADLDGDGDLDLLVVSDFAGAAFFLNDGKGRFSEASASWAPPAKAFGMAHVLADFDADGRSDFLMMGMLCPTPQRLDHAGLKRPGFEAFDAMRPRMSEGNRLFRGRAGGGFEPSSLNASIRRSGWSWGCAAADLDCDGFPDVLVANGHETHPSVRDYEGEFWRHDIYVGKSEDDPIALIYFKQKIDATRGQGWSYGGWEKNRLFMNREGRSFVEVGHLMGTALAADSRDAAAADLDGDGRPDLVVTTFEVWPERKQTLQVFRNTISGGHWIGVRLHGGPGRSVIGTEVTVVAGNWRATRQVITGDSHRTQHPATVHFGLGAVQRVDRVEVRWPGGRKTAIGNLRVDAYADVSVP